MRKLIVIFLVVLAAAVSAASAYALLQPRRRELAMRQFKFRFPDGSAPTRKAAGVAEGRSPVSCGLGGGLILDGEHAWRVCALRRAGQEAISHLVRFDLVTGIAELRWPIPESLADAATSVVAIAFHPAGKVAMVFANGGVAIADAGGAVADAGKLLPGAFIGVAGVAWVGEDLEVVPRTIVPSDIPPQIHVLSKGRWRDIPVGIAPAAEPDREALLEMYERSAQGDRIYTYLRAENLVAPDDIGPIDIITMDGQDPPRVETLRPAGGVVGMGLDRSSAGVLIWDPSLFAPRAMERSGGRWRRFDAPPGLNMDEARAVGAYRVTADYVLTGGRLRWIPRVAGLARIDGEWVDSGSDHDDVRVLPATGGEHWILTDDHLFARTTGGVLPQRPRPISTVVWVGLSVFPATAVIVGFLWLLGRRSRSRLTQQESAALVSEAKPS